MPQIINTNIASLNAQRNLNKSQSANQTSLQRLSSGLRINSAKDDAAGLAISTRFNSQIRGLNVAVRNAGDGISLAQTAEGALGSMNDNLQRVRELAVQSANATNSDVDREALQAEVSQLLSEVSRTADETDFNGRKLLDGSFSATFQIGANAGQTLDISIAQLTSDKLGSSDSAGLSAQGSDNALANGDLIINGVPISPSSTDDDTSSIAKQSASAIAKVAAINKASDATGVTAYASENIMSGAEMVGSALTGIMTLNGVEITLQTTSDTSTTRAGLAQAINAVSDQTGVTAIDNETDALGISLVAADGRNITVQFDGTLTKATTGIDGTTSATVTETGGYTLVANSDVPEIVITGGNGTGNGDVANSGLTVGTYDKGVASVTSTAVTATTGDTIDNTNFFALEGSGTAIATLTSANNHNLFAAGNAGGGEILTISDGQGNTATIGSAGDVALTALDGFGADSIAAALNTFAGVSATAETVVVLEGADLISMSAGAVLTIRDTGTTGTSLGTLTFAGNTTSDTAQSLAAQINAQTTGLVATILGTAGNSDIQITDINGNTLSFSLVEASGAGETLGIETQGRDGSLGASINVVGSSTANNSLGTVVVSTGYISDIEVDDTAVGEFTLTSNKALAATSLATVAHFETVTTYLATNGSQSSTVTSGADVIDVSANSVAVTQQLTGLGNGDLVLNGVNVGGADAATDTASSVQDSNGATIKSSLKEASGIAIASAINDIADETGVRASVYETVRIGGDGTTFNDGTGGGTAYVSGDSGKVYINGVDIGAVTLLDDGNGAIDEGRTRQSTIDLINAKAGQTGVLAEDNGESITLRAADGRNISVAIDNDEANNQGRGNTFGSQIGLNSALAGIGEGDIGTVTDSNATGDRGTLVEGDVYETSYSSITLTSAQEITISGGSNGSDELAAMGLTEGAFGGGTDGQFLTEIDISTFEGATAALTAIDNAIGAIASQRADLGAIQNRMESTVSNLAITSENLSAANSRIQDADFAAETAELSRTQVLQQAGISILSQANQGPQQVLSLLG